MHTLHSPLDRIPVRRRGGFTLIEILVATAILTLGLVGILALFPVAIQSGRRVIEDSNAAVIAQSVAEAIRSGIRTRKGYSSSGNAYFVFNHDGVQDSIPTKAKDLSTRHDYYVLLPSYKKGQRFAARSRNDQRVKALRGGRTFVYPESDPRPNGNGNAQLADDDSNDFKVTIGKTTLRTYRVDSVYSLGNCLVPRGQTKSGGKDVLDDMLVETLKQYSFAFAIRPSFFDANLAEGGSFQPANQLYHVTVLIYRGLLKDPRDAKKHRLALRDNEAPTPVYELDFEVAL